MRTVISFFSLFFVLSTFCPSLDKSVIVNAHKTTHLFTMTTPDDEAHCSSTAIGPHALLTATHCKVPMAILTIDGKFVTVSSIMDDGQDHSIYILGDIEFKDWAVFSTETPVQGDEVFIFGNPKELRDMFRKGTLSGFESPKNDIFMIFDLNGFFGDSGAGIFNEKGQIMGVISYVDQLNHQDASFKVMASRLIRFSNAQLAKIK